MKNKTYSLVLTHATTKLIEVLVFLNIALNMKAFVDSIEIAAFIVDKGVKLVRKGYREHLIPTYLLAGL